jgi:hypothetical protein
MFSSCQELNEPIVHPYEPSPANPYAPNRAFCAHSSGTGLLRLNFDRYLEFSTPLKRISRGLIRIVYYAWIR